MRYAVFVSRNQSFDELCTQAKYGSAGKWSLFEPFAKRTPRNQLHRQEIFSFLCAELENRFDVWMFQLGQRQCLFPEQLTGSFVGNGAGRQDLERYVAVCLVIVGAVHFAHSSSTDLFDDVVMAEGLANHLEEPPMSAILGRTLKQVNVVVFSAFPA